MRQQQQHEGDGGKNNSSSTSHGGIPNSEYYGSMAAGSIVAASRGRGVNSGATVECLPAVTRKKLLAAVKSREGDDYGKQLETHGCHKLLQKLMPADAFVIVGFTCIDLYPRDDWNFVYGEAQASKGTGIFSFARYGDAEADPLTYFRRAVTVLCHEIGHLFGLSHCIWLWEDQKRSATEAASTREAEAHGKKHPSGDGGGGSSIRFLAPPPSMVRRLLDGADYFASDGMHPNDKGYAVWADLIAQSLLADWIKEEQRGRAAA